MAYQKPLLLNLQMKDVVLIKPSKSPPSTTILCLSTVDNRPDLNSLCQIVCVYRSEIHNSDLGSSQLDPVLVVKEALSKALLYYYPLAGRLVKHADGNYRVIFSAEFGVPFIEAVANCNLSSIHYLDGTDTEIAKQLVAEEPPNSCHQYPLVFKVTKFNCGGFTIGIGISHVVADGFGTSQFYQAIVELARGRSEPSVKPVWERERLVGSITEKPLPFPLDKASAAVSPFLPATNVLLDCFKVSGEIIRKLKLSLMREIDEKESLFTSFEALTAFVWRSRTRALKQNNDGKTMLSFMVGTRRHLSSVSPLPDGYYGNAMVDAFVVLTVRELNEKPLFEVASRIREAKNEAFTVDYIRNFINTFEMDQTVDLSLGDMGAVMALTDWKYFGLSEGNDFGGREAVNLVPAPGKMFDSAATCIFAPPNKLDGPSMKGGVRIFTTLPIDAVPKFREEMEALKAL